MTNEVKEKNTWVGINRERAFRVFIMSVAMGFCTFVGKAYEHLRICETIIENQMSDHYDIVHPQGSENINAHIELRQAYVTGDAPLVAYFASSEGIEDAVREGQRDRENFGRDLGRLIRR